MINPCREAQRRVLRLLHGPKTRTQLGQIHAHLLRHGLDQLNQLISRFVSVCYSLNKMHYANLIFQHTHNPNILLFNAMIKGFSLCHPFEKSLHIFSDMKRRGVWPDEYTFAPLLKSCSNICHYSLGRCVHGEVLRMGFEWFGSIRVGILELYVTCGRMGDAQHVFDEMSQRDVIVWNLMIRGFCKSGNVDTGLCLFRQMGERNVVSWNSMISCLAHCGRDSEALGVFNEMREESFEPDEATVVSVLPACARLGDVDVGKWIHSYADSKGLLQEVVSVGNSLVSFYCKCGDLDAASSVFDRMAHKNVVSWNSLISGYAFNGRGELGINLFEEMMNTDEKPNDATFVGALTCCAHAGLVEKGRDLFASMTETHRIEPKLEHYGCMVDVLGRSGCLKEAHDLIKSMPMKPNAALWGALLGACSTHGEVKLAELAAKELIDVETWNSGNYVLLSNIYAEEGRWDEVEKVRDLMKENCITKAPGQSAIGKDVYDEEKQSYRLKQA
ncbi:pentatricopeptide repeat-containing protein At1g09190 [Rosa rugosa]|uniref:pentatricopeptide repeat-containing protein At1g09190 n=1 Tax=Rosa rugosa TaxID=74645 RepID=UPI002B41777D|nr:pentatricopeptide repeat-containing protein At1g09190 [Rosa rugosa]